MNISLLALGGLLVSIAVLLITLGASTALIEVLAIIAIVCFLFELLAPHVGRRPVA